MKNSLLKEYFKIISDGKIPEFLEKYLIVPSLVRLKNIGYFVIGLDGEAKLDIKTVNTDDLLSKLNKSENSFKRKSSISINLINFLSTSSSTITKF